MQAFFFVLITGLGGCRSLGPDTIPGDSFNYNNRIVQTSQEEMLHNLVRVRYGGVPQFLTISSVINQYSRSAGASIGTPVIPGSDLPAAGVTGGWSDRPTITYSPLSGQAFSKSMLQPLPPSIIFYFFQAGSSTKTVMRFCVQNMNGLKNEDRIPGGYRQADPDFIKLIDVLQEIQTSGVLGSRLIESTPEPTIGIYFPQTGLSDSTRNAIATFKQLLKLDPNSNEFVLQYGLIQDNDLEISINTNSMLEILYAAAWHINVPPEHIEEGRTLPAIQSDMGPLINIKYSKNHPDNPYIAIKTEGYWFYLDQSDFESKSVFAGLQILLNTAADVNSAAVSPLISVGR